MREKRVFIMIFCSICIALNIILGIVTSSLKLPLYLDTIGTILVAVGLIVGFNAKKFKFRLVVAIITGLILSVVCPFTGTPIGIWVYGVLTGTGEDFLFMWLQKV